MRLPQKPRTRSIFIGALSPLAANPVLIKQLHLSDNRSDAVRRIVQERFIEALESHQQP